MAPKKENPVSQADLETIMAKLSILDSLTEKIQALESLPRKIDSLEKLLQESNAKVVALQAEINTKDKIITDFKNKTNSLEQYNRKWSKLPGAIQSQVECEDQQRHSPQRRRH